MRWRWPLPLVPRLPPEPGRFGIPRLHDVHTGIDLYAPPGAPVVAAEGGEVVAVDPAFTGGDESPWWNQTSAVMVEGDSGVVLYGEVHPAVEVGRRVAAGDQVGVVAQVLRPRPGKVWKNPPSMLHLELYERGARAAVWWKPGDERPAGLLDPTRHLEEVAAPEVPVLAVVGVLRDGEGRVLMLRRYDHDREARGLCFPGGKVDPGESIPEGLQREFLGETGFQVGFGSYVGVYWAGRFEIHALEVVAQGGALRDFPSPEHAAGLWVRAEHLDPAELAGIATRAIVDKLRPG